MKRKGRIQRLLLVECLAPAAQVKRLFVKTLKALRLPGLPGSMKAVEEECLEIAPGQGPPRHPSLD